MNKIQLTKFEYKAVAKLDMAMWDSYFNGNRGALKLFIQAFKLIKLQLGFSWLATLEMAYFTARAALYYRLKKHNEDYAGAERYLNKLFHTVSNNCSQPFDFKKTARLELEWWDIERYPEKHKKSLEVALAENMACLFNVPVNSMEGYGTHRARAIKLIADKNHKANKSEVEIQFKKAWESLHSAVELETD
jgi:hypothetical protein